MIKHDKVPFLCFGSPWVEMAVEDTKKKEQMGMRTKNNWRKTILEPDDESGASRANAQALYIGLR